MKWYYVENGQQAGPVEETEFPQLSRLGKLRPDTLMWHEGMANWEPFNAVCPPEYAPAPAAILPTPGVVEAVCGECGGIFDKNDMIPHGDAYICAKCKPVFMQKLAEGVNINTGGLRFAGFWIRVGAKVVDGLIVGVPFMILIFAFFFTALQSWGGAPGTAPDATVLIWLVVLGVGYLAANAFYNIFFVGRSGATPGKMICKIKIVTGDGGRVSYGRATGRCFAELGIVTLGNLFCYVLGYADYLAMLFDKVEKRTLHDRICNTRVIYR